MTFLIKTQKKNKILAQKSPKKRNFFVLEKYGYEPISHGVGDGNALEVKIRG